MIGRMALGAGLAAMLAVGAAGSDVCGQSWLEKGKQAVEELTSEGATGQELSTGTISDGLKEALRVGTASVVQELGRPDGFYDHPDVHIPLPGSLSRVQSALEKVGASSLLDDLELKLNRAAERATPRAKALFWQSIREMTLEDVRSIYNGPDDAATRYFQGQMSGPLAEEMQPVVEDTLSEVGAVQSYDRVMDRTTSMPFVPDVKANLVQHTLDKTLEGIFTILAREEAAIRTNPVKRSTELLRTVFGRR